LVVEKLAEFFRGIFFGATGEKDLLTILNYRSDTIPHFKEYACLIYSL